FEKGKGRGTRGRLPEGRADNCSDRGTHREDSAAVTVRTQLRSLDSVLAGRRADFIKMDIEGAERNAVQGAAGTIKTFRPRMLVAAYHRTEDLFAVPEAVLSIRPDYELYLRKDPAVPAWGVNYIFL
ncbi:MAG: FkbM family methyltransferase, partial [Firmicutes bacterium]|nr:FkbM family methyltransferase [Bacillota bacterium]